MAPERYVYPVPQNVTLFEIRVLADVIKVTLSKGNHPGLVGALNPRKSILIRQK